MCVLSAMDYRVVYNDIISLMVLCRITTALTCALHNIGSSYLHHTGSHRAGPSFIYLCLAKHDDQQHFAMQHWVIRGIVGRHHDSLFYTSRCLPGQKPTSWEHSGGMSVLRCDTLDCRKAIQKGGAKHTDQHGYL